MLFLFSALNSNCFQFFLYAKKTGSVSVNPPTNRACIQMIKKKLFISQRLANRIKRKLKLKNTQNLGKFTIFTPKKMSLTINVPRGTLSPQHN